jgi:hypothetical protein
VLNLALLHLDDAAQVCKLAACLPVQVDVQRDLDDGITSELAMLAIGFW